MRVESQSHNLYRTPCLNFDSRSLMKSSSTCMSRRRARAPLVDFLIRTDSAEYTEIERLIIDQGAALDIAWTSFPV